MAEDESKQAPPDPPPPPPPPPEPPARESESIELGIGELSEGRKGMISMPAGDPSNLVDKIEALPAVEPPPPPPAPEPPPPPPAPPPSDSE
jgi:protein TonB